MAVLFDIREMLMMAVKEEQTGYDYYRFLSQNAKQDRVKKLAEKFAGVEKHHEKLFKDLLNSLADFQPTQSYEGEYQAYLFALMEGRMFPEENRAELMIETAKKDDLSAINIALMFERSTLFLFREIENYIPSKKPQIQEIINRIINEEKGHLVDLSLLKNELRQSHF